VGGWGWGGRGGGDGGEDISADKGSWAFKEMQSVHRSRCSGGGEGVGGTVVTNNFE